MEERYPIRIAQIIGKMWAGGVENVIFNYYRAIDHRIVQFDFYYDEDSTVSPPQDLIKMGARFYMLPPYQKIWKYIPELKKHLKEKKYRIIHSHLNSLSVFPLFTAWSVRLPVRIAHNHSVPGGSEWKRNLMKNFLKIFSKIFATDFFACSEKAGRWLFGNKAFDNGNVIVIKNAIDFSRFYTDENKRKKLMLKYHLKDVIVYGHVGRFTYAKNHKKLLNIFKEIKKTQNNAKLLLVGDGELHDEICRTISELELEDCTILVGQVDNPEEYYCLCDVLILPSLFEGFSITTVEAQVSRKPIVISKAVPEEAIISDGCEYVDVCDSNNIWAKAAMEMIGKKVQLNAKAEEFKVDKCAQKLQKWYCNKMKELVRHF